MGGFSTSQTVPNSPEVTRKFQDGAPQLLQVAS